MRAGVRAANSNAPGTGAQPLRRRTPWLSQHPHAFAWLAFAILVLASYVGVHKLMRCDYIENIRQQVKQAVELYALRQHVVTGVLEVTR